MVEAQAIEEMKDWQHGIPLSILKEEEKFWSYHNSFSASPFSQIKKNNIAEALHERKMRKVVRDNKDRLAYIETTVKVASNIYMYGDVKIGTKLPGDHVITGIAYEPAELANYDHDMFSLGIYNKWVYTWAVDDQLNEYLDLVGYTRVGSKISTFGEIQYVWFKDAGNSNNLFGSAEREHPEVPQYEKITVKCVSKAQHIKTWVTYFKEQLDNIDKVMALYTNHYSNYNKKNAWSAISLRGYKNDIKFIEKPIEMSKKWKEENPGWEKLEMQDTDFKLKGLYDLLYPLFGKNAEYHRIRLMKLAPGGGELTRHTDQVDPDQGLAIGKLLRFHFPIVTNPNVKFTVWTVNDVPNTVNMKVGECWVLDVRKPHRAINEGKDERIHLVVDVIVNDHIMELLTNVE